MPDRLLSAWSIGPSVALLIVLLTSRGLGNQLCIPPLGSSTPFEEVADNINNLSGLRKQYLKKTP